MKKCMFAVVVILAQVSIARAHWYFAVITGVDADKQTIAYRITSGRDKTEKDITVKIAKNCVIKGGFYRLGKPAVAFESDDIADGLKNAVFKNASAEKPLRVNLFISQVDDPGNGIVRGDVVKILVNPPPKKNKAGK